MTSRQTLFQNYHCLVAGVAGSEFGGVYSRPGYTFQGSERHGQLRWTLTLLSLAACLNDQRHHVDCSTIVRSDGIPRLTSASRKPAGAVNLSKASVFLELTTLQLTGFAAIHRCGLWRTVAVAGLEICLLRVFLFCFPVCSERRMVWGAHAPERNNITHC